LLVDTHVILWWLTGDDQLSDDVASRLSDEPEVHLSAATVWEIAVKQALGKLDGPDDLPERLSDLGFRALPMTAAHAVEAARLPSIHRDPFDRMLIAQARLEGLVLVSADAQIARYDVQTLPP
jgi:PIN domain nuclease of toxin-antitoxin system